MSWTVTDDDNDVIQVRASINTKSQQDELRALIHSLHKRLDPPVGINARGEIDEIIVNSPSMGPTPGIIFTK